MSQVIQIFHRWGKKYRWRWDYTLGIGVNVITTIHPKSLRKPNRRRYFLRTLSVTIYLIVVNIVINIPLYIDKNK